MVSLSASHERVLQAIRAGQSRAQEIAAELHVDVSGVRRHLATLQSLGLAEGYDIVAGPGRPQRHYRLTALGRETGPRNYPLLLAMLLQRVADGDGRKQLLRYLESIAKDLAGPVDSAKDARHRLEVLLARYNALGFEATLKADGGDVVISQRNCPFLAVASGDPAAICEHMDEAMMRTALPGAKVHLESTMARGDAFCRHRITVARDPSGQRRSG